MYLFLCVSRKRNARIYCELVSYGMSGDADHITAAREDGRGALLAMKQALKASIVITSIQELQVRTLLQRRVTEGPKL